MNLEYSDKMTEEIIDRIEKYAKLNQYDIDENILKNILNTGGNCPCRIGNVECPCDYAAEDIMKMGRCHCGLFSVKATTNSI